MKGDLAHFSIYEIKRGKKSYACIWFHSRPIYNAFIHFLGSEKESWLLFVLFLIQAREWEIEPTTSNKERHTLKPSWVGVKFGLWKIMKYLKKMNSICGCHTYLLWHLFKVRDSSKYSHIFFYKGKKTLIFECSYEDK